IAWFKIHRPLAFYAAYFSVRATEFDAHLIVQGEAALRGKLNEFEQKGNTLTAKEKGLQTIVEIALELNFRSYNLHKVDLYRTDVYNFLIVDNGLLPPLVSLQGLGDTAAHNIVLARKGRDFLSVEDLRNRSRISKTVIEILK